MAPPAEPSTRRRRRASPLDLDRLAARLGRAVPHPRRATTRELIALAKISAREATDALAYAEDRTITWCPRSGTWGRGRIT